MIVGSFRLVAFSLIVPLLVVACGSSSTPTTTSAAVPAQTIHGPGFAFETPATWRLSHTLTSAAARSRAARPATVSAQVFRLAADYSPGRFAEAAKELDTAAGRLAAAAGGKLVDSETTVLDGRQARAYSFTSSRGAGRLGFLLFGRREFQLLCQAPAGGDPDGACALLFSSFRLAGR